MPNAARLQFKRDVRLIAGKKLFQKTNTNGNRFEGYEWGGELTVVSDNIRKTNRQKKNLRRKRKV